MTKRSMLLILFAIAVIGVGIVASMRLSSKTLASSTIAIGETSVTFDITEQNGKVYVSAHQRGISLNGWHSSVLVGDANVIGADRPQILARDDSHVRLQVGERFVEFDDKSKKIGAPKVID